MPWISTYESRWQADCHLFTSHLLPTRGCLP